MLKSIFFGVLILFIFTSKSSFSQSKVEREKVIQDLDLYHQYLEKFHIGLYHYNSRSTIDSTFLSAKNSISSDSVDILKAYELFLKVNAQIKDFHTSIALPKKFTNTQKNILPIFIREFNNDYFLAYNASSDTTNMERGLKLDHINNEKINDLTQKYESYVASDNGNLACKKFYSERLFPTYYTRFHYPQDSLRISFFNQNHELIHKNLANETSSTIFKNFKHRYKSYVRRNFDFKIIDTTTHTALLDIISFTQRKKLVDFKNKKFKKLLRNRFKLIEKKGIENLIIDFRGNGGGYVSNIAKITSYIYDKPFQLLDSVNILKPVYKKQFPFYTILAPIVGKIIFKKLDDNRYTCRRYRTFYPKKKYHYNKNLYVLMDAGSYSATTFAISLWKDFGRGTFIGTQPAGANWGSFAGGWAKFTLPNTKFVARIPKLKMDYKLVNHVTKTFFVEPDFVVNQQFEDFMKWDDSVIKFTKNLINTQNQPKKMD